MRENNLTDLTRKMIGAHKVTLNEHRSNYRPGMLVSIIPGDQSILSAGTYEIMDVEGESIRIRLAGAEDPGTCIDLARFETWGGRIIVLKDIPR